MLHINCDNYLSCFEQSETTEADKSLVVHAEEAALPLFLLSFLLVQGVWAENTQHGVSNRLVCVERAVLASQ